MTQRTFRLYTGYAPVRHGNSGWDRSWSVTLPTGEQRGDYSLSGLYDYLQRNCLRARDFEERRVASASSGNSLNTKGVRLV